MKEIVLELNKSYADLREKAKNACLEIIKVHNGVINIDADNDTDPWEDPIWCECYRGNGEIYSCRLVEVKVAPDCDSALSLVAEDYYDGTYTEDEIDTDTGFYINLLNELVERGY